MCIAFAGENVGVEAHALHRQMSNLSNVKIQASGGKKLLSSRNRVSLLGRDIIGHQEHCNSPGPLGTSPLTLQIPKPSALVS